MPGVPCPSCPAFVRDGYEHADDCSLDGVDEYGIRERLDSWARQAQIDARRDV